MNTTREGTSPQAASEHRTPKASTYAALPQMLSPRGLSRAVAAAYLGISSTTFDVMVADGSMPMPKSIGSRRVWDRYAIDEVFSSLGQQGSKRWAVMP